MNKYQVGNTVTLKSVFYEGNSGVKIDASFVKLKIYDKSYSVIDTIPLTEVDRTDVGTYVRNYIFEEDGVFYYEFYGEVEGNPCLSRERIDISFL